MSSIPFARVLSQIINTPLMCEPRQATTFYNALSGRFGLGPGEVPDVPFADILDARQFHTDRTLVSVVADAGDNSQGQRPHPGASRFEGELVRSDDGGAGGYEPFMRTPEGVGIITVTGELVNRGAWLGSKSGLTSYEGISYQFSRAARDPKTKVIVLDMESPGGQVAGAFDLSGKISAIAGQKPVYTVVNGMAASAGYALASGSTRIINTPAGLTGSIGVIMMHLDYSKALEAKGISPTIIYAGDHKADGNPTQPLSDDVKAHLQKEVDSIYELFLSTVASGRGRAMSKTKARDTQARVYRGRDAVEVGLADDVGTIDEVLTEAKDKARRMGGNAQRSTRSASMSLLDGNDPNATQNQPAPTGQQTGTTAAPPAPPPAPPANATGTAGILPDPNARMAQILADPRSKGRERACMDLAIKSPSMSAEDVLAFVSANLPEQAAAPQQAAGSVGERVEATGVNNVPAAGQANNGATGNPSGNAALDAAYDWGPHAARVNASRVFTKT